MVKIKFVTATALSQIDTSVAASKTENSKIVVKKMKVLSENSKGAPSFFKNPIFTGNSMRGLFRRTALEIILNEAIKKGLSLKKGTVLDADNFHLMNCGGGNTHQTQPFDVEAKVRELNPLVSLLGASLAISGKLKTSNMIPLLVDEDNDNESYYVGENEEGRIYSSITTTETFIKGDDLLDAKGNAKYLSDEEIKDWHARASENSQAVSKSRSDEKATKVKKETIKSILDREFVVPGVSFYGSFRESEKLTDIEKGLIVRVFEKMVLENLGSNKSRDFGCVNYDLTYDDGSKIKTKINKYLESEIVLKDYKKETKTYIKAFDNWLENMTEENLNLTNVLV